MSKWLTDNMAVVHYLGTIIGLIINAGLGVAIYRKHVRSDSQKDMKIDLMWRKFVKDNNLNGTEVQD